jgi:hypothetical protein
MNRQTIAQPKSAGPAGRAVAALLVLLNVCAASAQSDTPTTNCWALTPGTDPISLNLQDAAAIIRLKTVPGTSEQAEWSAEVPCDGLLQFEWQYTPGSDSAGRHDTAGYRLGGNLVQLTSPDTSAEKGRVTVSVKAMEPFTFWIRPESKTYAPGKLTLRNLMFIAYPRIERIQLNESDTEITFLPSTGRVNRVQACRDLNTMEWFDASPDIITMDRHCFYKHARAAGDMMFYRIIVLTDAE